MVPPHERSAGACRHDALWLLFLPESGTWRCLRFDAAGETEAVNFPDHGIARNAVGEFSGDLTGAQSFKPKLS
jgi:hypothetical protein